MFLSLTVASVFFLCSVKANSLGGLLNMRDTGVDPLKFMTDGASGSGGGNSNPASSLLGNEQLTGGLLDGLTKGIENAAECLLDKSIREKGDCASKSINELKEEFINKLIPIPYMRAFSGPLLESLDHAFKDLEVCKQKDESNVWTDMESLMSGNLDAFKNPLELQKKFSPEQLSSQSLCRQMLCTEQKMCKKVTQSLCDMLGGTKRFSIQEIIDLLQNGIQTHTAESACNDMGSLLDPANPNKEKAMNDGVQKFFIGSAAGAGLGAVGG